MEMQRTDASQNKSKRILFTNHIILTPEYRAELAQTNHYGMKQKLPILVGALFLLEGAFLVVFYEGYFLSGLLCIVLGFGMLFLGVAGYKVSPWLSRFGKSPERLLTFTPTTITLKSLSSEAFREFTYDEVKRIADSDHLIILAMKNNEFVVVDKAGFIKGDKVSFGSFLESQCAALFI